MCHISPPLLIPTTVSPNNILLPKWKAKSNTTEPSVFCITKGCLIHENKSQTAEVPASEMCSDVVVICAQVKYSVFHSQSKSNKILQIVIITCR